MFVEVISIKLTTLGKSNITNAVPKAVLRNGSRKGITVNIYRIASAQYHTHSGNIGNKKRTSFTGYKSIIPRYRTINTIRIIAVGEQRKSRTLPSTIIGTARTQKNGRSNCTKETVAVNSDDG